jgi:hypothetical protein
VFGLVAWILRNTASAIAALLGTLMILPLLVGFLPGSLGETITNYLPSQAGEALASSIEQPGSLAPGAALAVLTLWVAGALAAGLVMLRRRDA